MCGIFCALSKSNGEGEKYAHTVLDYCSHNLQRRGPDHFQTMPIELPFGYNLLLAASVLQTQGEHLCTQPCIEKENVLCWNGDVFGGLMVDEIKSSKLSDTKIISKNLSSSLSRSENPAQILNEIVGPYSFIFYNRKTQTLWFGRDPAGRHSLLYGFSESPFAIVLSSVAHTSLDQIQELPALGIYEIDAKLLNDPADLLVYLHPWGEIDTEELNEVIRSFPFNIHIRSRICNQYIFKPSPFMFSKSDVDIMNLFSNIPQGLSTEDKIIHFLSVETFNKNMMKVLSLLEASVQVRVQSNVSFCQNCVTIMSSEGNFCSHSKIAVLFSGGLDSAILAKLVDKFLPETESIDLLNVAFEKKRTVPSSAATTSHHKKSKKCCESPHNLSTHEEISIFDVPDRLSGRKTFIELQSLCPKRKWNFVEINVPAAELQKERASCISHLIHPLKTVLDDSLGCALWFAARGQGVVLGSKEDYKSPSRIVITGMGADEQFGGYMRHRTTLKNHGWEALHKQLQMELRRIPSRNLGRDDRVVSHHGRQPRMPFLDERFISFVKSLPPWEKCCPCDELPSGLGDKLLLRLVAWHIGLKGPALMPKRAFQFGSRIANSKENAGDMSGRL